MEQHTTFTGRGQFCESFARLTCQTRERIASILTVREFITTVIRANVSLRCAKLQQKKTRPV